MSISASSRLSIEQIFGDTPLLGTTPLQASFSPNGKKIAYLKNAENNINRLNLWSFNIDQQKPSVLVDLALSPELFATSDSQRTEEEKAEAERKRMFSSGISSYLWLADSEAILFPVHGVLFLFDFASGLCRKITATDTRQTDFKVCPKGKRVSYVRKGELYVCNLKTLEESRLTHNASTTLSNGMAEFIAQEEMHRFDGHWWSADGSMIAFTQVDVSKIPESLRYEINADEFSSFSQRYPYAGGINAEVKLGLIYLDNKQTTQWIDCNLLNNKSYESYLARVSFSPCSQSLYLQIQSRDQKILELQAYDIETQKTQTILTEEQSCWVNLHNNLTFIDSKIKNQQHFLWTSECSGTSQLYLYQRQNDNCAFDCIQLTNLPGRVNRIVGVNTTHVFFEGWRSCPTEQHLYQVSLTANGVENKITHAAGWHNIQLNKEGSAYLDQFSNLHEPAALNLEIISPSQDVPRIPIASNPLNESSAYFPWLAHHATATLGELLSSDKQTLHYRLTRPSPCVAGQAYPVIVHVYGGPGVQRVKNEWCALTLQIFAQAGFGVFELDNRGSSNREKCFEDPIFNRLGEIELEDQLAGVEFLKTLDWVDASRIGVFGHSYGGYMALMCLLKAPEVFKAGISVAPVTDWNLYDTHYTERYLGRPNENSEGYRLSNIVPLKQALKNSLLVIHGMSDDNVLFTHSTKLFKALQDANSPFEMMTYPGAKHALQQPSVAIHRYQMMIDFFNRELS